VLAMSGKMMVGKERAPQVGSQSVKVSSSDRQDTAVPPRVWLQLEFWEALTKASQSVSVDTPGGSEAADHG